MKNGYVARMRFRHNDSGLLMLSKSLRGILRSEGRSFLNDSVAEDLMSRVSLRCATKNLHALADILRKGKLDDFCDDHLEILWLVSCSMECYKLLSRSALDALLRTAFVATMHEVRITTSMFKTREFNRSISYFSDVFPDIRIDHEKLLSFRDKAVSTIRHVSKLFRESQHRAAFSIAKRHEQKTSWPGLVALLRKEAKKLAAEYSVVSGGVIPGKMSGGKKQKNGAKNRHENGARSGQERSVERDYSFQDDDDLREETFRLSDSADSESDDQDICPPKRFKYEDLSRNAGRRRPRTGQLRGDNRRKARSRGNDRKAWGYCIDHEEEEIGSVRHGARRGKPVENGEDSMALVLGGLESQDFPSAVVSSKTDDAPNRNEQEEDRESIEESSEEHVVPLDIDFGDNITLSDELEQAKLEDKEACIQELHNASVALDRLGPEDPLDEDGEERGGRNRKARTERKRGVKRSPREASPIPDSEDIPVPVMKRRRRNIRTLSNSPAELRKGGQSNELRVKRGRFLPHEDEWLIEGMRKHGWGAWTDIAKDYFEDGEFTRTTMSLKDRARTLGLDPEKYPRRAGIRGRPPKVRKVVAEEGDDDTIENCED